MNNHALFESKHLVILEFYKKTTHQILSTNHNATNDHSSQSNFSQVKIQLTVHINWPRNKPLKVKDIFEKPKIG